VRIGIFGGSFDPPHIGHLIIAQESVIGLDLDKLCFMPLNRSKDKKPCAGPEERLDMLRMAIKGNEFFDIDDREIKRGGITYSIDSITEIKATRANDELFFILGTDALNSLPAWKNAKKLIKLVKFALYKRQGNYGIMPDIDIAYIDGPIIDVSSSLIRERVKKGVSIRYIVPLEIEQYIYAKGLYK